MIVVRLIVFALIAIGAASCDGLDGFRGISADQTDEYELPYGTWTGRGYEILVVPEAYVVCYQNRCEGGIITVSDSVATLIGFGNTNIGADLLKKSLENVLEGRDVIDYRLYSNVEGVVRGPCDRSLCHRVDTAEMQYYLAWSGSFE